VPLPTATAQHGRAAGPAGLGLVLPTFPQSAPLPTSAELGALCREAEGGGAAGLWACDHLYWHGPSLECLTAVSVAVQATTRCLVGSCVLQLPLRRPAAVAKTAASLQQLASGRVVLGLGVGTHAGEYGAAGVDYHRRGSLLDAGIAELRAAWSTGREPWRGEERPPGHSRYRQLPEPAPIPIWVGGSSDAARRRAASNDGWVPLFVAPDAYGDGLRWAQEQAERAGRDPWSVAGAVVVFVSVGADRAAAGETGVRFMSSLYGLPPRAFARHLVPGDARTVARQLGRFVEHGARHVIVFVADDRPLAQFVDLAGEFAPLAGSFPVAVPAPVGHPATSVR
jgi:alkanesulfonate monooxygenase SsuD/methylene tetrahydromethanopterin reductase-like flavin-dependent oxidoreductase (luciferase family)